MYKQFAASLALVLASALSASAATLPLSTYSGSGLTLLATSPAGNPVTSSSATFTATYQSGVFSDANNVFCSGCLDFSYYVVNDYGSPQGVIESVSASTFAGFDIATGYIANGGIAPGAASVSGDGSTVKFYFTGDNLMPGDTADYLIIQTNATAYQPGLWSIQDGSTLSLNGFEPTSVTPEPSSLILLGTGLLGAAGAARRKFNI